MKGKRKIYLFSLVLLALFSSAVLFFLPGEMGNDAGRTIHLNTGGRIKSLDPALSEDLASRNMVSALFDTLLAYDYLERPYKLIPSMLETMPRVSDDGKSFFFTLRDDLYFIDDACFGENSALESRKITSEDVIYSLKRLADSRLHSPLFWLLRDKVKGINEFNKISSDYAADDNSLYDFAVEGLEYIDEHNFAVHLETPDTHFLYNLATPYTAIVSRKAVEYYGGAFPFHPVGSGPFKLEDWQRDYKLILARNGDYRQEFFPQAQNTADRTRPLPLADRIHCYSVKQPFTAWLMFLAGELDMTALDKDNVDMVAGDGDRLSAALADRNIRLYRSVQCETRYIGFNFNDPVLGRNQKLRQAIASVYDTKRIKEYFNNQVVEPKGPIPPGVSGFDPEYVNPYNGDSLALARRLMEEAGYPGGIDPHTGRALELRFDQNNTNATSQQLGEMFASDLARIGIKVIGELNSAPRFYQKLRRGEFQLFRLSWIGDYPDGENFLQLFYSANAGNSNRCNFIDREFDRLYDVATAMRDGGARDEKYRELAAYVMERCVWIVEGYPISFQLSHCWLENFRPHDFSFGGFKFLSVNNAVKEEALMNFTPLSMKELRE